MSQVLKNRSVAKPPSPICWKDGVTKALVCWSDDTDFNGFFLAVQAFYERNGRPEQTPSDAELQDDVCRQLGAGWCIDNNNWQAPVVVGVGRDGRCHSNCGGR